MHTIHERRRRGRALATLLLSGLIGAAALPQVSSASPTPCFFRNNWNPVAGGSGRWKVTPDARTMYINVAGSIYRLDLVEPYPMLKSVWAVLNDTDSSNTICSADDFKLSVTDRLGNWEAPIVKKMTLLTPEEVAALPKNLRP
ncbi:MAG TPA: hypothetical protein VMD49_09970 [Steroidobacteraceae bacterium]|jgi:hypothetical protein|nr:hypothetical protein [Steroidobacteraceae bacterium]